MYPMSKGAHQITEDEMAILSKTQVDIDVSKMITTKEVAEIIGVTPQALYNWRQNKIRLPFYQTKGGRILYMPADVEKYLTNRPARCPAPAVTATRVEVKES